MTWGRYSTEPTNQPLTALQVIQSSVFAPAVLNAVQDPRLRGYLVDKSVPWDAVDLPLVTDLPRAPKDRAEVNYLIDEANEVVVRMVYRAATGNWVQVGAYPIVTTLPSVTTEGFQIIYDTGTSGIRWQFVYDTTDGTTYPWLFIGGPPLTARVNTDESTSSGMYDALATAGPSVTVPLAGDYIVRGNSNSYNSGVATNLHSYDIGGTGAVTQDAGQVAIAAANYSAMLPFENIHTGIAASTAFVSKYATTAGTANFRYRWLSVTPVRVV